MGEVGMAQELAGEKLIERSIYIYGIAEALHLAGLFKHVPVSSLAGIAWNESADKFRYASEKVIIPGEDEDDEDTIEYKSLFEGKGDYSLAIDKNHYIWIAWNDGSVWRGRLNKLGFKQQ